MLDVLIILTFVAYSVSSGFRNKKAASKNLNEYFLAGQSLSGWKAGLSMAATQYAADTPLLVTGLIATSGIFALWRLWVYALSFLMMGFLLSASWRKAGVLTDAEFTEIRYSGKGVLAVRTIKALYYGTLINCTVLAMVLVAAMRIAEIFCTWHLWLPASVYQPLYDLVAKLGWNLAASQTVTDPAVATTNNIITIVLITLFTVTYSATGGLRSVVATDVVQFGIAMAATLIYAVLAVKAAGGLGEIVQKLLELYGEVKVRRMLSFTPQLSGEAMLPFLVIVSLQWFFQMNSDGTGYLAQRSMGCRTDNGARLAAVVFTFFQVLVRSLFWLPICVALMVLYPVVPAAEQTAGFVAGRELLFAQGIKDLLPPGISGLMLTGLLAALASTLDTHMNWGAGYWSNDIYRELISRNWLKREPSARELVWVARFSNILIMLIAFIIMSQLGSIQQAWHLSLLFGAGMGAVLVLRWTWERINLYSEMAAMVSSIALAPILLLAVDAEWARLGLMALCSTLAVIIVTLITPPVKEEKLKAFFSRVQPAGFWRKTALKTGTDPFSPVRKLLFASGNIFFVAMAVFSGLAGFGKLMFPVPHESPLWALSGIAMMIVCGFVWWKISRKEAKEIEFHNY
jgi:Na+/proline symporter